MIEQETGFVESAHSSATPSQRPVTGGVAAVMLLMVLLQVGLPGPGAGAEAPASEVFAVTTETSHILAVLQEQWQRWKGAFQRGDRDGGEEALSLLLEAIRALGMESSSEYARAASAIALRASREGRFEQARWALRAAERLDPFVSETAFARSALYRAEGAMMKSLGSLTDGYLRIWRDPFRRFVWFNDFLLWMLAVVFLCGGFFVLAQAAIKGEGIYSGLVALLDRNLPKVVAQVLAVLILLWPALLPLGLLWLLVYWSVLLWSFTSTSERLVMALVWVLMAASPLWLEVQRQRLVLSNSPAERAIEGLDQHRLHGSLLADLERLSATLPDDPAVDQLLGDVHRRFGQWDMARARYLKVLLEEPENFGVLADLGVYYFRSGDLKAATKFFRQAVDVRPEEAIGHYNLSEALSASYDFTGAEQSLLRARGLDPGAVDRWIQRDDATRPVAVNGGLVRIREIRRHLHEVWRRTGLLHSWDELLTSSRSLPFAPVVLALAVALAMVNSRVDRRFRVRSQGASPPALDRWRRIVVPGARSVEAGSGVGLALALLPPTVLISLPVVRQVGYPMPWAVDPGGHSMGMVAAAVAVAWYGLYVWRQLRREGGLR